MSTSVKLAGEDKVKLEKLQALIVLKIGEKVSQQELLARLIEDALTRGDEFIGGMKSTIPMSDKDFAKMVSLIDDWGVRTNWREIDEVLYGGKKKAR